MPPCGLVDSPPTPPRWMESSNFLFLYFVFFLLFYCTCLLLLMCKCDTYKYLSLCGDLADLLLYIWSQTQVFHKERSGTKTNWHHVYYTRAMVSTLCSQQRGVTTLSKEHAQELLAHRKCCNTNNNPTTMKSIKPAILVCSKSYYKNTVTLYMYKCTCYR